MCFNYAINILFIDTLAILDFNRALNGVIIKLAHFDYVDIVLTIFLKYYFVISVFLCWNFFTFVRQSY